MENKDQGLDLAEGSAAVSVIAFYGLLVWFVFFGSFRNKSWIGCVTEPSKLLYADVPVILVLSTIPTLILISLLRHYRPTQKEGTLTDSSESGVSPSLTVRVCKELADTFGAKP